MSFTSIDIMVVLSLLICGLLGMARGAIRQLVSIACCALAFVGLVLLASPIVKTTGASPTSVGNIGLLVWVFLMVLFLFIAARIVHVTLPTHISTTDRVLGLLLGFFRGFGVVAIPLMFFVWLVPGDKLPNYMRNALSFPLLKSIMDMLPSLQLSALPSRVDWVSAFWLAIGFAAIPSALADIGALVTRRRRLRRLDQKNARQANIMHRGVDAAAKP